MSKDQDRTSTYQLNIHIVTFWRGAIIARQREVKCISTDTLASPTVLCTVGGATVGEATVAWWPTIRQTGHSIGPVRCYIGETRQKESLFQ
jgi:hypothetical protein